MQKMKERRKEEGLRTVEPYTDVLQLENVQGLFRAHHYPRKIGWAKFDEIWPPGSF